MRADEVRCREVVELLTDYLDGALPPEDLALLEQHLLYCEPCAVFLEQMRATITLTGRIEDEAVPEEVVDQVVQVLREREGR